MKQYVINFMEKGNMLPFLIVFLLWAPLKAQDIETKQVHFKRGTSGTTIEGTLVGRQIVDYVLGVQEGQVMNVSMGTDNTANYFNVMEPGEQYVAIFNGSMNENMYEGTLAKSGEYRIRVYMMRSAARRNEKANYRLEINVSGAPHSSASGDAKVAGTNYHATGMVPCSMGNGQPTGNCDFGVEREGNGSGMVTVTKPDGSKRVIFFENGKAIRYDQSQADQGHPFKARKESDLYIIHIGSERYEIPEAVIYGG